MGTFIVRDNKRGVFAMFWEGRYLAAPFRPKVNKPKLGFSSYETVVIPGEFM